MKEKAKDSQKAIESSRTYTARLIVVSIAANEVVKGAVKDGRYYVRVSKQRLDALRRALETLRKQRQ